MNRFSDFKLGMASLLKPERAGVARAASSNAFAIATFSCLLIIFTNNFAEKTIVRC